jgi:pimeloyl-ACP methyl ester carboxylesterase
MTEDGPTSGYAKADDGHAIYYEVHGVASDRVPVVLLHGGMMAIQTGLTGLIAALAPTRRVVAVEYQGHGHTGDREGAMTIERMAQDVAAVLGHLGVAQADLIGHSLGGMIATGVAIAHPDLVRVAGIVSAGRRLEDFLPELVILQRDQAHQPSPELAALLPTPEDFASWQAHYARVAPEPGAFMNVLAKANVVLTSWPGWSDEQLASIRVKTLLIVGDNDFFPVESIVAMQHAIPRAQLAVLPGATHMKILDRAAWIAPMMEARAAAD